MARLTPRKLCGRRLKLREVVNRKSIWAPQASKIYNHFDSQGESMRMTLKQGLITAVALAALTAAVAWIEEDPMTPQMEWRVK